MGGGGCEGGCEGRCEGGREGGGERPREGECEPGWAATAAVGWARAAGWVRVVSGWVTRAVAVWAMAVTGWWVVAAAILIVRGVPCAQKLLLCAHGPK